MTKRYGWIDAIRGYAILGVIAVHTAEPFKLPQAAQWVFHHGARGVQLFFFASAVTLMMSWSAKQDGALAFYKRRLFRIAPMWWLAVIYWFTVLGLESRYWAPDGLTWAHIAATAIFAHGWSPTAITSVVPGGWSISVEMTFYLVFPLLALNLRSWKSAGAAFLCSLVLASYMNHVAAELIGTSVQPYIASGFLHLWFFNQLPVFLFGILAFHLGKFWMPYAKCIAFKPMQFLGKISYSAYFWHMILLTIPVHVIGDAEGWRLCYFLPLVLLATAAASWVTYICVEQPCIRFGGMKISAHFSGRSQHLLPPVK